MKKLAPLFLLLILLANSCKSSKIAPKTITGVWKLESIEHSISKNTHKQLFINDAIESCFKQSHWSFKTNSNTGNYFINDLYCKFGERGFAITPLEADRFTGLYNFLFTLKTKKGKSLNETSITMKLLSITEMSMQWQLINPENTSKDTILINFKKEVSKQEAS
jgi:hypothetical protein